MTTLIAWLHTMHTPFITATTHSAHQWYATLHTYCSAHHQLTAYAQYPHRVVLYCYGKFGDQ